MTADYRGFRDAVIAPGARERTGRAWRSDRSSSAEVETQRNMGWSSSRARLASRPPPKPWIMGTTSPDRAGRDADDGGERYSAPVHDRATRGADRIRVPCPASSARP